MRNPTTSLLPVLAALFALDVLGMPEDVAAQDSCTVCQDREEEGKPPKCVPTLEGMGYDSCRVVVTPVGKQKCRMSSTEPDCEVGLAFALDGRAVDVGSGVATAAAGRADIPRWQQLVVPVGETLPAMARSACTGAVIRRRYTAASIAELRAGLRRVTV